MEDKIVSFLVQKYNPIGIILHGSRAGQYATTHSDWDIFLFTDEEIPNKRKPIQEVIEGQYIDAMYWQFPVSEDDLKKYFAKYLGMARLLYSKDSRISDLFSEAQSLNQRGLHLSEEEIQIKSNYIGLSIERLSDWVEDDSGVFFLRVADLYLQFYNAWWNIKQKKYSISPRKGILIIKEEDELYYSLLQTLVGSQSNQDKYNALLELNSIVFPERIHR